MIEVKISGLSELQKTLEEMPRDVARKIIRGALNEAADEMRDHLVAAAHLLQEVVPANDPDHFFTVKYWDSMNFAVEQARCNVLHVRGVIDRKHAG